MEDNYSKRKVQKINNTLWISLPKKWTEIHLVKKGDALNVASNTLGELVITPNAGDLYDKTIY